MHTATVGLLCLALIPAAYAAPNCTDNAAPQPLTLPAAAVAPAADEFYTRSVQLGMPTGVLAQPYSGAQSVDRVLLRLRLEGCQDVAKVVALGDTVNPKDPAAYQATTKFDNTPWRFDMSQNGKRMTAEEFDTWMKARGVRVVKPRPIADAAASATVAPAANAE